MLLHAGSLLKTPWLMPSGYLAVDLFFVMSGFVIAHSYDAKLPTLGLWGFMKVRAVRLYPVYLLGLGLGLPCGAILALRHAQSLGGVASAFGANLFFLPAPPSAFAAGAISPLDGPAWSLFFEMWINILYGLLFPRLSARVLSVIVFTSAGFLATLAFSSSSLNGGPYWSTFATGAARVCFSFPLGVLLYRWRDRLPDLSPAAPLVLFGLIGGFEIPGSAWHDLAFVLLASPLLVIAASQGRAKPALAAYGAAASYCLYAIHFPLFQLLSGATHMLGVNPIILTFALIAALLVLCPIIDRLYDRPLRRWLGSNRKEASEQGAAP
jgi:peptidoglycan/LPS O-acetylase OafA/YrhL